MKFFLTDWPIKKQANRQNRFAGGCIKNRKFTPNQPPYRLLGALGSKVITLNIS